MCEKEESLFNIVYLTLVYVWTQVKTISNADFQCRQWNRESRLGRLAHSHVPISIYSFWPCSVQMWSFVRLKQNHWWSYRNDEYTDEENWINSKQFYIIKVMIIYLIHNLSQGEKKERNVRINLTIRMNKVRNEEGWKKIRFTNTKSILACHLL